MNTENKNLLDTLVIEDDKIIGKNIKITNLGHIVDNELYLIEQKIYGTTDISATSSSFDMKLNRIEDYNIILDFTYTVYHFAVNEVDKGTKTDTGELSVNIFTNESSITVKDTQIKEPYRI